MINNFGLHKNPFSKYSAEEELEQINSLFFKPNYYDTLVDDLKNGSRDLSWDKEGMVNQP